MILDTVAILTLKCTASSFCFIVREKYSRRISSACSRVICRYLLIGLRITDLFQQFVCRLNIAGIVHIIWKGAQFHSRPGAR